MRDRPGAPVAGRRANAPADLSQVLEDLASCARERQVELAFEHRLRSLSRLPVRHDRPGHDADVVPQGLTRDPTDLRQSTLFERREPLAPVVWVVLQ